MWQGAWDVVFSISSLLLALLFGVAVGNVVTGVPIDDHGWFQGLFNWMLNPYALLMGVFSLALLMLHGAHYLCVKTDGALRDRAQCAAGRLWGIVTVLGVVLTAATFALRPQLLANYRSAARLAPRAARRGGLCPRDAARPRTAPRPRRRSWPQVD